MRIEDNLKLDFDDVLIKPKRSVLTSRSEVELVRDFGFFRGIPIMAANMDTTGTFAVAEVMMKNQMFTCLHKHYAIEELTEFFSKPRELVAYSMGITEADQQKWKALKTKVSEGNVKFVCIDVANGYSERFIDFVEYFKQENSGIIIIAGNVVTAEVTEQLVIAGVDIVKVGIGPGSACTTRLKTGVGYPQLSAIIECADAAHGLGGRICSDGGCRTPGDVAKALATGADFVMLGGMLAGHDESGGELITVDGKDYKVFYGMSSDTAQQKHGGSADYRASEGRTVKVACRGKLQNTIIDILGGIRSTCTYVGAKSTRELSKCTTFIRVNNTHNREFEDEEI